MNLLKPCAGRDWRRSATAAALIVLLVSHRAVLADEIDITWNGGNANWNAASNWSPEAVPNNGGGDTYNVFIDGNAGVASEVILDLAATINNLSVDAGDELAIDDTRSLRIAAGGAINNHGTISLNAWSNYTYLYAGGDVTLSGGGIVTLYHATLDQIRGVAGTERLINQDNTIQGAGRIGNNAMALTNQGTIEANRPGSLVVDLAAAGIHDGLFKASSSGTLVIKDDLSGSGSWLADGGKIQLDSGVDVTTTGPISVIGGGELELNDAAIAGSDLTIDASGTLDVGSTVSLSGDLSFAITAEGQWDWASGSKLEMTGGAGASFGDWDNWASLEIGGYDFGSGSGFSANFELPELVVGADAHLLLADAIDNGNRGGPSGLSEALYVDTLTFADTFGQLDLRGLHLYYNTLSGDPGQIIDSIVPEPSSLIALLSMAGLALVACARRRRRAEG